MTDSHTRRKLWPDGYTATVPINYRQSEFLRLKKYYLSSEPNKTHNCSKKHRKDENDDDWLVFLLSFGLQQTTDLNQMTDLRNGNFLLREAKLEHDKDSLSFPKSICSTKDGIIAVADAGNNRVIGFNTGGVQVFVFEEFEFLDSVRRLSMPISLCSLVNGNIVVCNYGNSTINIISPIGTNRIMFQSTSRPICIDSDHSGTIFVLTEAGEIEEFSRSGKMIRVTKIQNRSSKIYTIMTVAGFMNEIYLGKQDSPDVLVISKWGDELRHLTLNITDSGLNMFLSNLALTGSNDILACDYGNRSVHVFDHKSGVYKSTLINGKSGLGCVQAVCVSTEKLIFTTEYCLTQRHCAKIFSCNNIEMNMKDE